jgi:hypothetical protein
MTLIIEKPTGAKLNLRKGWQPMDADAAAYITAVETADTEPLEERTKIAIDNFVLGCKADGIWSAIKASCILAGARTLAGALVPLVGTAPTRYGTEGDWNYNRKTGLKGNGTNNYVDSNRLGTEDGTTNTHFSVYLSAITAGETSVYSGIRRNSPLFLRSIVQAGSADTRFSCNSSSQTPGGVTPAPVAPAFFGVACSATNTVRARNQNRSFEVTLGSLASPSFNHYVFTQNTDNAAVTGATTARLAFYSIGESLDLTLLDARVTDLINAFAAAIP